jgi:hypothetical protein
MLALSLRILIPTVMTTKHDSVPDRILATKERLHTLMMNQMNSTTPLKRDKQRGKELTIWTKLEVIEIMMTKQKK